MVIIKQDRTTATDGIFKSNDNRFRCAIIQLTEQPTILFLCINNRGSVFLFWVVLILCDIEGYSSVYHVCPFLATDINARYWAIPAIGKHVVANEALTGGDEDVRIEESTDFGVVITALQIIKPGLGVIHIATIGQGVRNTEGICHATSSGQELAPSDLRMSYILHPLIHIYQHYSFPCLVLFLLLMLIILVLIKITSLIIPDGNKYIA